MDPSLTQPAVIFAPANLTWRCQNLELNMTKINLWDWGINLFLLPAVCLLKYCRNCPRILLKIKNSPFCCRPRWLERWGRSVWLQGSIFLGCSRANPVSRCWSTSRWRRCRDMTTAEDDRSPLDPLYPTTLARPINANSLIDILIC